MIKNVTGDLCPSCDEEGSNALYKIFPMKVCTNFYCADGNVWRFWSFVLQYHFDGQFMVYPNDSSYLKALYIWITGRVRNVEGE